MSDNGDFDRRQEREEDREERKFSTQLMVEEMSKYRMQRCCVFTAAGDGILEVIHGRLVGMMTELDAMVVRDLRIGRETLQTKQIVPVENVLRICSCPNLDKCRQCSEYRAMVREAEQEARQLARRELRAKRGAAARKAPEGNKRQPRKQKGGPRVGEFTDSYE